MLRIMFAVMFGLASFIATPNTALACKGGHTVIDGWNLLGKQFGVDCAGDQMRAFQQSRGGAFQAIRSNVVDSVSFSCVQNCGCRPNRDKARMDFLKGDRVLIYNECNNKASVHYVSETRIWIPEWSRGLGADIRENEIHFDNGSVWVKK